MNMHKSQFRHKIINHPINPTINNQANKTSSHEHHEHTIIIKYQKSSRTHIGIKSRSMYKNKTMFVSIKLAKLITFIPNQTTHEIMNLQHQKHTSNLCS